MKKFICAVTLALACMHSHAAWDLWDAMKAANLDVDHIVDYDGPKAVTTSEGQSYGMFFALVAGDRETFDKLLVWTEKNLAAGDFSRNLPSWLYSRETENGEWKIRDVNNATDSDMWIAWNLLEAGRLWNRSDYAAKGRALLLRIKDEVRNVENIGAVLRPGRIGFETRTTLTLNPSYYPIFLLQRFTQEDPFWESVLHGSVRALIETAPNGFSPDWAKIQKKDGRIVPGTEAIGSYDSIRVYLWAGLISKNDPVSHMLTEQFHPMVELTEKLGLPPEKVNCETGEYNRLGNIGFGAAMLPLMPASRAKAQIRTALDQFEMTRETYYKNVLTLFGRGYDDGMFRIDAHGQLIVNTWGKK